MPETVAAIHRILTHGSSFPSVVETTAGRRYVMKLSGAGPGRRALATEFIALKFARHLDLKVPDAEVLDLPRHLPWQVGTDEFYETAQRSAGVNLGVAFIPEAHDLKAADLAALPGEFLGRLAAVDALLQNVDRTMANPNVMRDAAGVHWAIDFGACLLLDRLARGALEPRLDLPANHFLAGNEALSGPALVRGIAAALDATALAAAVEAVPDAWLQESAFSRGVLLSRLQKYVESIRASRPTEPSETGEAGWKISRAKSPG